ncbi:MAG: nucleotidyltransferase domain-containing protein [Burkholderiales bacterium]
MSNSIIDPATKGAASAFWDKLGPHFEVSRALLFGSRARNTHSVESDADIAVILRGVVGKFIETKFAMDDLAYEVLLDTGIRIQPLPIWQEEWDHPENYSNPRLIQNIKKDGIQLDR